MILLSVAIFCGLPTRLLAPSLKQFTELFLNARPCYTTKGFPLLSGLGFILNLNSSGTQALTNFFSK